MYDQLITIYQDRDPSKRVTSCTMAEALERNKDHYGVYWHVNRVRDGIGTKATKDDVTEIRFAHADIDPPDQGPWDKDAVLAQLIEQGASVVIDSGNGLQAVWALLPGATIDQVELVNKGLMQLFGADDTTWNADRVLRVPGTINWPNKVKRAKGRVPAPASEVWRCELVYPIENLLAAWPYVEPPRKEKGPDEIEPVAWEPIPLPDRASPELYEVVHHPQASDRSSDVMRAVVMMGRENFTDAEIMGILLNPELPISAHCLDQNDPERQARRKAAKAIPHRPKSAEYMFGEDTVELPPQVLPEPPTVTKARKGGYGARSHGMFMGISEQMDHFTDCIYIMQSDRVLMPDGMELSQSRFDVARGGHLFAMDDTNEKTSKSAWEAFLKNNAFTPPTAHSTCFRPELPPFTLVEDGTWQLVNTYQPINTPRKDGDVGPFLRHMETLFPIERDRRILLSYMASLVQNPGVKFQWWPVIQGAKGNGKTLLLNILTYCVGEQYSHLPNTSKMTRNGISFNGWLRGKLFLGMDEVYSSQRRDFLEEFKPYVTNRRLPIESKGVDEYTGDNRANGMMLTNHKDGVPVDKDERRYAVFFTKQQTAEECFADGLTPDHFQKLWAWLDRDGFAIINGYLRSYVPDVEFDPAGRASRAPRTSSTDSAIIASRGRAETEIMEAIEDGRVGFKGGYISAKALRTLMEEKRINLPLTKYKDTLEAVGYVIHPNLPEGRTPGVVMPDNSRVKLYVPKEAILISGPSSSIADDYMEKQLGA